MKCPYGATCASGILNNAGFWGFPNTPYQVNFIGDFDGDFSGDFGGDFSWGFWLGFPNTHYQVNISGDYGGDLN